MPSIWNGTARWRGQRVGAVYLTFAKAYNGLMAIPCGAPELDAGTEIGEKGEQRAAPRRGERSVVN